MNCINKRCNTELADGSVYCHICGKKQTPDKKYVKRPNGAGTVYKLQGKRRRPWVAAKNKQIIGYYETKASALEALESIANKPISDAFNMTFKEVYEKWKAEHFRELTPKGIEQYEKSYKYFEELYDKKFRNLKTADFQAEIDKRINKGLARSTVEKEKQLINQMSKWAMKNEIINVNLAQFVKLPKAIKTEKKVLTDDDIKKLEKNNSETARVILMLTATGMRSGELFELPLEDYHGRYCIGGNKSEAGRNRIIPIRPEGRKHFEYFAEKSKGQKLLLDSYEGNKKTENFRARDFYPLLDELKIDKKGKSPHSTRHTYASRAVKEGMKPEVLQKILGHAQFSTTADIYVHSDIEQLIAAVEPPKVEEEAAIVSNG